MALAATAALAHLYYGRIFAGEASKLEQRDNTTGKIIDKKNYEFMRVCDEQLNILML